MGCNVYPAGSGTIDGNVKYQYALVNGAGGTASNCTVGTGGAVEPDSAAPSGEPVSDPTVADCINSGQGFGTVNNVVVCTGPVDTITSNKTKEAETPANGPAKTTETEKTTVCTPGQVCTTTTSSKVTSGGSGPGGTGPGSTTASGDGKEKEQSKADFCAENPLDAKCVEQTQGAPAAISDLYAKGTRTIGDALGDFKAAVMGAPVVSAASNYFSASIPAGSCSGLAVNATYLGKTFAFDPGDILCGSMADSFYAVLGLGVMLAAGWVAFRIAIL